MGNCCRAQPIHLRRSSIDPKELAGLPSGAFLLKVWLHECERLLRPADFHSDPFVSMHLTSPGSEGSLPMGDQKQTSSCVSGELNPRWLPAEIFSFIVHDPSSTRLVITVKDKDILKKDSDLGDAYVRLASLVDANGAALPKKTNEELKLIDPRTGQQCGGGSIIRVDLALVPTNEARGEIEDHLCESSSPWPLKMSSDQLCARSRADEYEAKSSIGHDWGATKTHFASHGFHGRQFSSVCGTFLGDSTADFPVREGYAVKEPWFLTSTGTADGWLYSRTPGSTSWSMTAEVGMGWRRRTWCRVLERSAEPRRRGSSLGRALNRLSRGPSTARHPTVDETASPYDPPTVEMVPRPTAAEEPPTNAHAGDDAPTREAERTSGGVAVVSNPVLDKDPPADLPKPAHPPSAVRSARKAAAKATGMHGFFSRKGLQEG